MKNYHVVLAFFILTSLYAQTEEDQFIVIGDLSEVKEDVKKVYYRYKVNGFFVEDSALVMDKTYKLDGLINEHIMLQTTAKYEDTAVKADYGRD